jgi:lipopolysaccharide transport system ATP-binding protein
MRFIQRIREEKSLMFVSHDANAVLSLCDKAMLLDKGKMAKFGRPKEVMEEYTKGLQKEMALNSIVDNTKNKNDRRNERKIKESWTSGTKETYKLKWHDYRTELINKTELANKMTIKKFKHKELQCEDYGGDLAKIKSVTLTNIETNQGINVIMGGELVNLEIIATTYTCVKSPIVGFLLKNDKGVTLLGENSYNKLDKQMIKNIGQKTKLKITFAFTIPILPSGEYSISASIADGDQKQHKILHWKNDAIVLQSHCSSVAAGVAGVPMHLIRMETI